MKDIQTNTHTESNELMCKETKRDVKRLAERITATHNTKTKREKEKKQQLDVCNYCSLCFLVY